VFWHVPPEQVSVVQVLPSLHCAAVEHDLQLGMSVWVHPVVGLHASVVQGSKSLQPSAVPDVHAPAWQVSAPLQTLPSLHGVPLAASGCWHWPPLHASIVQGLTSSHWAAVVHD
jgi:hypothetical protein